MKDAELETPSRYAGVMVSSTFRDLAQHRAALIRAIEAHGLHAVAMERDAALPHGTVVERSLQKVREASAYAAIIGHNYGQVPESVNNPDRLSLTELEFREARRLGRPILLFVMSTEHPLKVADVERDPARIVKLEAFREDAKRASPDSPVERVYAEFDDLVDFELAAFQSMAELRNHLDSTAHRQPSPVSVSDTIPAPPMLYAEPRYVGSHAFVGRELQLRELDGWASASDPHSLLLLDAIGGTGKSMLTWEWVSNHAWAVRPDWSGVFWYSFYEKGAIMADFCRRALTYMTGRPLQDFRRIPQSELSDLLLRHLQAKPWLFILDGLERVLVAYHRYDAAQLADEHAGQSDQIARRDPCASIRPKDDDLLRSLSRAAPSKILVTSRLIPEALLNSSGQPIPGALHRKLPGLQPTDAEALLRACGVTGDPKRIRRYLQQHCDCHPLVTGIVAGLVNDYLPARGQFDAWAADPEFGGYLDLADLKLVQKRNHILQAALRALPNASRQLLSTLSLISEGVDFKTLDALNPHLMPRPEKAQSAERRLGGRQEYRRELLEWETAAPGARRALGQTVRDLERRGLVQYDRFSDRYDLHPVVRAVALGALHPKDRENFGQRVIDHFTTQASSPYKDVESAAEMGAGLTVVSTLLRLGRTEAAYRLYHDELAEPMLFNLEAHAEVLAILRPFFTTDWEHPVARLREREIAFLATDAGMAMVGLGEPEQALTAHGLALRIDLAAYDWNNLRIDLLHLARVLGMQGRLARCEKSLTLGIRAAEAADNRVGKFVGLLRHFDWLAETGRVAEAEQTWQTLDRMGRDWPRGQYRAGDAETRYATFEFRRGRLTARHLAQAEKLAAAGRNRVALRQLHLLRGTWLLGMGNWEAAAASLSEAVRLAREAGIDDSSSESRHAFAQLRLNRLPDPEREARRLSATRAPDQLALAELWSALGRLDEVSAHAAAAYRHAWADGEPYVRRYRLDRATQLLRSIGVAPPRLPSYDPAADPPLAWEQEVDEALRGPRRRP